MATNPITKSFDPSTFNEIVPRVFITYKGGAEYASTGLFGAECFINTAGRYTYLVMVVMV